MGLRQRLFVGKVSTSSSPDAELSSAVVLFDSYGLNLIPYMAEHYRTFVTQPVWRYTVDYGLIKKIKPDQIITILAERSLGELLSAT